MRNTMSHDLGPTSPTSRTSPTSLSFCLDFQLQKPPSHVTQGDPRPVLNVPRRAAESLSLEASCPWRRTAVGRISYRQEFIETYAKPGLPVIITGLNVTPKDQQAKEDKRGLLNSVAQYSYIALHTNKYSDGWYLMIQHSQPAVLIRFCNLTCQALPSHGDRRSGALSFSDPVATSPWRWADGIQDPTAGEGLRKLAGDGWAELSCENLWNTLFDPFWWSRWSCPTVATAQEQHHRLPIRSYSLTGSSWQISSTPSLPTQRAASGTYMTGACRGQELMAAFEKRFNCSLCKLSWSMDKETCARYVSFISDWNSVRSALEEYCLFISQTCLPSYCSAMSKPLPGTVQKLLAQRPSKDRVICKTPCKMWKAGTAWKTGTHFVGSDSTSAFLRGETGDGVGTKTGLLGLSRVQPVFFCVKYLRALIDCHPFPAGFTVPKYFAGDYFQRAGFESYRQGIQETGSSSTSEGRTMNTSNRIPYSNQLKQDPASAHQILLMTPSKWICSSRNPKSGMNVPLTVFEDLFFVERHHFIKEHTVLKSS